MTDMTVSEVSKVFQISTRMLRYYEKIGLISSKRKENYAYRIYDENSIKRLHQIIILRKLRIPLKQIAIILDDYEQIQALQIMHENIFELDNEINALSIIREILSIFILRISKSLKNQVRVDLLEDSELIEVVNALSLSKLNLKEEYAVDELNKASKIIENKMEIRIIYLPPMTVASSHYIGENPEDVASSNLECFIKEVQLIRIKPDFRVLGFNNPSPKEGQEYYGYEFWVTIPHDMDVVAPLEKKVFAGGLYVAHCIKMGDFHEWRMFVEHVSNSKEYEIDWREPLGMQGGMEEHLNAFSVYSGLIDDFTQLDLLIPIKFK